jgi:hypothetical protein
MGLIERFLPERLPRQVLFAGDRHVEIFQLQNGRIARARLEGIPLAGGSERDWDEVFDRLHPEDTGIVFNASRFIYNFFEFDKLPWQKKALHELVSWRLQKIFPDDIAPYDHRYYRLDKKRVLSILAPRALMANVAHHFQARGVPLTFIGNSTLAILARMNAAKPAPNFFIENDRATCVMVFQSGRSPIYIRKFHGGSPPDTVDEIEKTMTFVRNQYNVTPRSYWLVDYQDGSLAEAAETKLAAASLSRLKAGPGEAPHIPGSP